MAQQLSKKKLRFTLITNPKPLYFTWPLLQLLRQNSLDTASAEEAAEIAEYERNNEVKKVTLTHTLTLTLTRKSLLKPDPDPHVRVIGEWLPYDTS